MKKLLLIFVIAVAFVGCTTKEGKMEKAVNKLKATLPQPYGTGMEYTDVVIEKDYVVYQIEVDERKRAASLEWDEELIKMNFKDSQDSLYVSNKREDMEVKQTYRMYTDCNKGLAYQFIGKSTQYTFKIEVPCEELKKNVGN